MSVLRPATAGDVPALVALRVVMFAAMGSPGTDDLGWRDAYARWLESHLDDDGVRIVVVEVDGAVVSTATGILRDCPPAPTSAAPGDVLVNTVATFEAHRRRGHSRSAVEDVVRWAESTGAGRVELVATSEGAGLYRSLGFVASSLPLMRRPSGSG